MLQFLTHIRGLILISCLIFGIMPCAAWADQSSLSTYALQQALSTKDHVDLYMPAGTKNFNIDSSYFSGPASGVMTPQSFGSFNNNDQQLYALLIDGRYDFNSDDGSLSSSSVHPYIMGGMGVATTAQNSFNTQGGDTIPLFRLGGGVAYRLGQQWDLSLDYKTGLATPTGGDQVFTGRSQQPVDLQALNLGMSYAF
jgi:hypothetical protein